MEKVPSTCTMIITGIPLALAGFSTKSQQFQITLNRSIVLKSLEGLVWHRRPTRQLKHMY
jgi:hypothetical protein